MNYIDMRVCGLSDSELKNFLVLCRVIQDCGSIGTGKTIEVKVDGDGSGKMKFFVLENGEEINIGNSGFTKESLDDFQRQDRIQIFIGE